MSKNAPLTSSIIALKGGAKPVDQMPTRSGEIDASVVEMPKAKPPKEREVPLNFSVPASWKKRFAQAALNEDMKHKELLFSLFADYEKRLKLEG